MKFVFNNEGQLVPHGYLECRNDPVSLSVNLTNKDIVRVLAFCNGDTSKLTDTLRQAVAIKAGDIVQKQKEFAERRKEEYKRRSAALHNKIMGEIRELSGGMPFTATSLQLAAVKNPAFPVRSLQMYHSHMAKALSNGEPVKRESQKGQIIVYFTKSGKERQRRIGYNASTFWSFTD